MWVAGSVPGSADTAGFTWRVDDRPPVLALPDPAARPAGDRYAGGLGWTRLGPVPLSPGRHTLALTVTEPARAGGFHLKVDALVLSREPFQPNGIRRPDFRLAQDVSTIRKPDDSRREEMK